MLEEKKGCQSVEFVENTLVKDNLSPICRTALKTIFVRYRVYGCWFQR
jgi:hypothetical protein